MRSNLVLIGISFTRVHWTRAFGNIKFTDFGSGYDENIEISAMQSFVPVFCAFNCENETEESIKTFQLAVVGLNCHFSRPGSSEKEENSHREANQAQFSQYQALGTTKSRT